jgi:hypothetical protein
VFGGGGIRNFGGTLTLQNSTLSGNSAVFEGGGICNSGGTVNAQNSTLAGNSAGNSGGGIYNYYYGTLTLQNSLIVHNSAIGGPDCWGEVNSLGYNLVGQETGCPAMSLATRPRRMPAWARWRITAAPPGHALCCKTLRPWMPSPTA